MFTFRGGSGAPGAGWDEYKALYWRANVFQEGPAFEATVVGARLDGAIVFDRRLSGIRHERGLAHSAEDGFDHYTFQLILSGKVEVDSGAGWLELIPGEAVLLDMREPGRLRFDGAHLLTASIARPLALAAAGPAAQHARRLTPEVTAQFRAWLLEQEQASDIASFATANRPQLLFRLLSLLAPPEAPGKSRRRRTLIQQAMLRAYVDRNLGRRDLNGPEIGRACGLSRAALYRLTAPYGGVMRYLQKHRLAELERLLARGDRRTLRELAEALGFADASHLVRHFRAAAGVSPGRYRSASGDEAAFAQRRWSAWLGELR